MSVKAGQFLICHFGLSGTETKEKRDKRKERQGNSKKEKKNGMEWNAEEVQVAPTRMDAKQLMLVCPS